MRDWLHESSPVRPRERATKRSPGRARRRRGVGRQRTSVHEIANEIGKEKEEENEKEREKEM